MARATTVRHVVAGQLKTYRFWSADAAATTAGAPPAPAAWTFFDDFFDFFFDCSVGAMRT
jgi:hypothetical protein